jgi:hypothetical protein
VRVGGRQCVVYVGLGELLEKIMVVVSAYLLACTDAPVDLLDQPASNHLEQYDPRARI